MSNKQSNQEQPFLRQPPHSIDAEQAVLGGLLLVPEYFDRVAGVLSEEDFHRRDHQMIFRAIEDLQNSKMPPDAVTLGEWFDAQGIAELVGGSRYILELANTTPSAANVVSYANIVRSKSILRKAINIGDSIMARSFDRDANAETLVSDAIRDLMALSRAGANHELTLRQACEQVFADINDSFANGGKLQGITTGIEALDEKLGGFHPGDLVLIPARPSIGKTSLLGFQVAAAARSGVACGLISGEQPAKQIAARLLSAASKVTATKLRSGRFEYGEFSRLCESSEAVKKLPVWIMDRSAPHIREVERVARKWVMEHGCSALYVDYAQRCGGDGKERHLQVGDVARGLKSIARDLNIPVIALAQVNRGVEGRADKRPGMGDIADSGELEKEADVIVMMYRDDYYNRDSPAAGTAELIVEKNRHGATGVVRVGWESKYMDFFDLANGREAQQQQAWEGQQGGSQW